MVTEVFECEFTRLFRLYAELLEALGLQLEEAVLAAHLAGGEDEQEQIESLMRLSEEDPREGGNVAPGVTKAMQALEEALCAELREAGLKLGCDLPCGDEALLQALRHLPEDDRESLADAVLLKGHAQFLRRRYMDAATFHRILRERHDPECLAMVKLVPYLSEQLRRRGFDFSEQEIREFFDEKLQRRVPCCLKSIMAGVNGQFSTGLIPLEDMVGDQDPKEWLERVRRKLLFRSHSAMHKAIAEATSLKYDCVHKALSGSKKAKRIQAEIKYCLDRWLKDVQEGRDPQVSDEHRGVPVEWTCALLPQLEERFKSKEEIYRVISEQTGIKAGSVRRYFQSNGQLKCAPLSVYRLAKSMAAGDNDSAAVSRRAARSSYLADQQTRRTAWRLAARVNAALRRWRADAADHALELEYRQLRRMLIMAIKEQRSAVPAGI